MTARTTAGLLFVAGAVLSAITALQGIQPNDEGLMLQAAARIAGGQTPYADFWWFYPPGQPYLLAGLHEAFGPSLLWWRVVRVLADASVAVLAWALARRRASPGPALAAWGVAALAMAYPSGPHPFPLALAFALGALLLFERRPAWAGLLAGLCAAWRIEFAAYLGLGVLLALALRPVARRERLRAAGAFAGVAGAAALLLYLPVVARAGLGEAWDLLIRYPLEDFSDYQSLPFPFDYDGPLNTSSPGGFLADSAEPLLLFYLPLALVAGFAGSLLVLALDFRRERDWPLIATAVYGAGMAHYLLVRPDAFHTAPLAVLVAVLGAWALAAARETLGARERRSSWRRTATLAAATLAALAIAYALVEGADRRWLALREDTTALAAPAADGVRAATGEAGDLDAAIADVRRRVPAGQPTYVLGARADITTAGAPLVYVLAERPNPTRYDIAAPGVVTSAPVQREIIADLRRTRPRAIVRWTDPVTAAPEPNRAGRSSGVRLLDAWLAREYRTAARYGDWAVLAPRAR